MCGIVGMFSTSEKPLKRVHEIDMMMRVQEHRGPDDSGVYGIRFNGQGVSGKTSKDLAFEKYDGVFGFNRLSIRDISENGHQPMLTPNKQVAIVFNGEIYNADDYREILKSKGYVFRSSTDTEVILYMYCEYGFQEAVTKLNGMFAVAIFDNLKRRIYIARDRFGIKPLYYVEYNEKFVFASEMKSICVLDDFEREIDKEALDKILLFRGNSSLALLKGVKQLQPGEMIEYTYGGKINKKKYFDLDKYEREPHGNLKDNVERFEHILKDAVDRQLISDVKVGCQLSGGIDSSLITNYANKSNVCELKDSISIVFPEENKRYSEEKYIDHVVNVLDIDAHKYILEPNFVLDNIEKMVWHLDTIAGTPNAIGIMQLSKAAKEHVTVLLSGEGADEVFGGYWTFPQGFFWNNYVNFVSKTRIDVFNKKNSANYKRMEKGFDYYVATTHGVTSQEQFCMMRKKSDAEKVYEDLMDERMTIYNSFSGSLLDKHLKYKMATNLPDLLVRQDKMSMSASIENRVPFLDNDIVDFSFTVPENNLIGYRFPREGKINLSNVLEGKFLLKKLSEKTFGNDFTYRGKMGFSLPLNKYFSEKNFRNYFHDEIYSKMRDRDLINAEYILSLFEKGETMTEAEAKNIWLALNVEIWCQLFLDKKNYR